MIVKEILSAEFSPKVCQNHHHELPQSPTYHQPSDSYQSHNQLHHLLTNLEPSPACQPSHLPNPNHPQRQAPHPNTTAHRPFPSLEPPYITKKRGRRETRLMSQIPTKENMKESSASTFANTANFQKLKFLGIAGMLGSTV